MERILSKMADSAVVGLYNSRSDQHTLTNAPQNPDRTADGTYLRLIELLEKRISQLETQTATNPQNESAEASNKQKNTPDDDAAKKTEVIRSILPAIHSLELIPGIPPGQE